MCHATENVCPYERFTGLEATEKARLEVLIETHASWARSRGKSLARTLRGDVDKCESTALAALVTAAMDYKPAAGEFKDYAVLVVSNRVRDFIRDDARAARKSARIEDAAITVASRPPVEINNSPAFKEMLTVLTPQQQQVIGLRYGKDRPTTEEIAVSTDRTRQTVEEIIVTGLATIKRHFGGVEYSPRQTLSFEEIQNTNADPAGHGCWYGDVDAASHYQSKKIYKSRGRSRPALDACFGYVVKRWLPKPLPANGVEPYHADPIHAEILDTPLALVRKFLPHNEMKYFAIPNYFKGDWAAAAKRLGESPLQTKYYYALLCTKLNRNPAFKAALQEASVA